MPPLTLGEGLTFYLGRAYTPSNQIIREEYYVKTTFIINFNPWADGAIYPI